MASFLSLSEEAYTEIAKLGADASGQELSQVSTLVEKEDYAQLYQTLSSVVDKVIENASDVDAEAYALVLIDTLTKLDKYDDKIAQLASVFAGSQTKSPLRLKLLIDLLNSINHTHNQHFALFVKTLQYAKDTKQIDNIVKYVSIIDDMLSEWNTSVQDKRNVYLLFSQILSEVDVVQANSILIKYLSTFAETPNDINDTVVQNAIKAVVYALQQSDYNFDGLTSLVPVQQLQQKDQKVHELLNIFASGSLSDFEKYGQSNKDVITRLGLNYDALLTKIRLLTLVSLAANATSPIAYSELSKQLNIDESQVESVVIRSVGQGYLDAKLNQLNRTVTINHRVYRQFNNEEWKHLGSKITNWQDNVSGILQTIKTKKELAFVEPPQKK